MAVPGVQQRAAASEQIVGQSVTPEQSYQQTTLQAANLASVSSFYLGFRSRRGAVVHRFSRTPYKIFEDLVAIVECLSLC